MDSFKLSVMYETAVSGGGNSAKSQGPEAETLRGRNAIYLQYVQIGWDSLTLIQQQYVESLAKSCVYTHGYGVYKARSLWTNMEPGLDYDDLYICTDGNNKNDAFGGIKEYLNQQRDDKGNEEMAMKANSVIVFPNPARDEIKIRHSYSDVKSLTVELYDYTGRKIKVILCKDCNQETSILVSEFASGLYTYKVIVDNNLVLTGKLNIIK